MSGFEVLSLACAIFQIKAPEAECLADIAKECANAATRLEAEVKKITDLHKEATASPPHVFD